MANNTKKILPEDGLFISREWLENEIERTKSGIYDAHLVLIELFANSTPLTPIVEDAYRKGNKIFKYSIEKDLQSYLSHPITIKLENNGKL